MKHAADRECTVVSLFPVQTWIRPAGGNESAYNSYSKRVNCVGILWSRKQNELPNNLWGRWLGIARRLSRAGARAVSGLYEYTHKAATVTASYRSSSSIQFSNLFCSYISNYIYLFYSSTWLSRKQYELPNNLWWRCLGSKGGRASVSCVRPTQVSYC